MKGQALMAAGLLMLALAGGTAVGLVPALSVSGPSYYYVCTVTSSTGNMVVSSCGGSYGAYGVPPGQPTFTFYISLLGPCASVSSPSNYQVSWSGANPLGPGPQSTTASAVYPSGSTPPSSLTAQFTATNGPGSDSGTITVYLSSGTSSSTGTTSILPSPCQAPTTTTTQAPTTTQVSTDTATGNAGGSSGLPLSFWLFLASGAVLLLIGAYEEEGKED